MRGEAVVGRGQFEDRILGIGTVGALFRQTWQTVKESACESAWDVMKRVIGSVVLTGVDKGRQW